MLISCNLCLPVCQGTTFEQMSTSFESLLGEITSRGRYALVTRLWCHFCPVCFTAFRRYLISSFAINIIQPLVEPVKIGGSNLNKVERGYLTPWFIIQLFIGISSLFRLLAYNILSLCLRDIGFSGKTAAVVRHALRLLEDDVMVTQTQRNDCEEIRIEPKLVLPHILNLVFYSNQVYEL